MQAGKYSFIDAAVLEDHGVELFSNGADNCLVGQKFMEDAPLGLFVLYQHRQSFLPLRVLDDHIIIGTIVEKILPTPYNMPGEALLAEAENPMMNRNGPFLINNQNYPRIGMQRFGNPLHAYAPFNRVGQRRRLNLTMFTFDGRRLLGFDMEQFPYNYVTPYTQRYTKLYLNKIHTFDVDAQIWDNIDVESFQENGELDVLDVSVSYSCIQLLMFPFFR
jgi:hypothetical protein